MCDGCAEECPTQEVAKDVVDRVVGLIEDLYELEPLGGPLHVELDDWNIEDHFWKPYEGSYSKESITLSQKICDEMLDLTLGQRNFIMMYWEDRQRYTPEREPQKIQDGLKISDFKDVFNRAFDSITKRNWGIK